MEVKLVVTNGRHSGREILIKGPKFFIGRAEDCHMRPGSDLVSRHHCVLLVKEDSVTVRDFGSKNGTFVNGEQVSPECRLKPGDRLVIGQLDFDVKIEGLPAEAVDSATKGATTSDTATGAAAEASTQPAEKTAPKKAPAEKSKTEPAGKDTIKVDDDLDISQWFGDDDGSAKTDTQTIDMSMIAKQSKAGGNGADGPAKDPEPEDHTAEEIVISEAEKERRRKEAAGDKQTTQDAAAEMLKKFFNARR